MWFSQSLRSGRKSRETPGQPGSKTCIDPKRRRGEVEGGEEEEGKNVEEKGPRGPVEEWGGEGKERA